MRLPITNTKMSSIEESKVFIKGDLVWAKMKSYPWWPGIILDAKQCGKEKEGKNMWVFFFGDHTIYQVDLLTVIEFETYFSEKAPKTTNRSMMKAVAEALDVVASRYSFHSEDPSVLLQWAFEGFPKITPTLRYNTRTLPHIVLSSLKNISSNDDSDEEDDEKEFDKFELIEAVKSGRRVLEEICISCCRSTNVVCEHPLFIGGLCVPCKQSVEPAVYKRVGMLHDFCILCGLGGCLVYCSREICQRTYCSICLEYMTSRQIYLQVIKSEEWLCYLCQPDPNTCMIKRRIEPPPTTDKPYPPIPEIKMAINVISSNRVALHVLEQRDFVVDKYYWKSHQPPALWHMLNDRDREFITPEFEYIKADLICYSYLEENSDNWEKKEVKFHTAFHKFLYRYDSARCEKERLFYIFIAETSIFNEVIGARIYRFLEIEPTTIILGSRIFYVWTNMRLNRSAELPELKYTDVEEECEEEIFNYCVDFLKKYFLEKLKAHVELTLI